MEPKRRGRPPKKAAEFEEEFPESPLKKRPKNLDMIGDDSSEEEEVAEIKKKYPGIIEPPFDELPEFVESEAVVADTREDKKLIENKFKKEISYDDIEGMQGGGVGDLFKADDIDLKTELNPKEIVAAARCMFIAQRYEIEGLGTFVETLLRLKVSKERKGRFEFIQGLHAEEKREAMRDLSPIQALLGRQ